MTIYLAVKDMCWMVRFKPLYKGPAHEKHGAILETSTPQASCWSLCWACLSLERNQLEHTPFLWFT